MTANCELLLFELVPIRLWCYVVVLVIDRMLGSSKLHRLGRRQGSCLKRSGASIAVKVNIYKVMATCSLGHTRCP